MRDSGLSPEMWSASAIPVPAKGYKGVRGRGLLGARIVAVGYSYV